MNKVKWMASGCFGMALALLTWGCAGSAGSAVPFSAVTGQHPVDWIQVHYAEYMKTPDQCRTCHGSTTDPSQAGGIAKVSCFSCHTSGVVIHPDATVWTDHLQHGRNGAQLAPVVTSDTTVPVMAGFSHCQKCHGPNYTDGIAPSCKSCHTTAPHPPKPWSSANWTDPTHVKTDPANAPACVQCHYPGSANNPAGWPVTPAAAGTAPGCFNNTLCHGTTVPTGTIAAAAVLHP
jgi:hypothetical protein